MSLATFRATQTWMIMAISGKHRITLPCGIREPLKWAGHRIATVTGIGSDLGAGRGSTMRLGALRHSIMVAGHLLAVHGVGAPVRSMRVHFMVPPLSGLLVALILASASVLVAAGEGVSVGSRWVSASRPIPGITPVSTTSET